MPRRRKHGARTAARPRRWERTRWMLVCIASGVLWFISCADFDIWPLAWVAMVPCLYAIERASTTRRAVLFGWTTGIVANAGGFYWITNLLVRFAHLPLPVALFAYLLMCGYQAITFALFAWAARRIRERWALPMTLVAPVVMVAFELVTPMLFPWYLAITQAWQRPVIQIADLTGPLGVSALLLMVNGAVYDLLTAGRRRAVAAGVAGAVLAAALGYGFVRIGQVDAQIAAAPRLKVGLVQGNIPFNEKGYEHPQLAAGQLHDLKQRSAELEKRGAELIIWTETAFPYMLPRSLTREPPIGIRSEKKERLFSAPLIFGALTYDVDETGQPVDRDPYNTAILMDEAGSFVERFDKQYLVMFSEHIPLVEKLPWLRKILPRNSGNLTPGHETKVFNLKTKGGAEIRAVPMICFEDIISSFSVAAGRKRPQLLVNITNDAWFGNTSEPWEHLALSVYRTVETRTALVRAVNTGVSAVIDPTGRITAKTYAVDPLLDPKPADTLLAEAPVMEGGHTVYVAVGDLFGYLCLGATALLWLVLPRLKKRS